MPKMLLCYFAYVALSYFSETQGVTSHWLPDGLKDIQPLGNTANTP